MDPYLVFYGAPPQSAGNLLLDELIDADIRFTNELDRSSVDGATIMLTDQLTAAGRRPYLVPRGGATALGAVGYVRASLELAEQLLAAGLVPSQLWLATGSCGTQAGLVAGARWLSSPYEVVGVTVSRPQDECVARIASLADGATQLIDPRRSSTNDPDGPTVVGNYIGPGYGHASRDGDNAARLVARTEGVFLDPVFGAKAMAALSHESRAGRIAGPVVFLIGGGAPTLFAGEKGSL
jgi:D-cysteine desulfhydrase